MRHHQNPHHNNHKNGSPLDGFIHLNIVSGLCPRITVITCPLPTECNQERDYDHHMSAPSPASSRPRTYSARINTMPNDRLVDKQDTTRNYNPLPCTHLLAWSFGPWAEDKRSRNPNRSSLFVTMHTLFGLFPQSRGGAPFLPQRHLNLQSPGQMKHRRHSFHPRAR